MPTWSSLQRDSPRYGWPTTTSNPAAGYSLFESLSTSGMPSLVVRGGSVVLSDGELVGPENGRYLARFGQK